MIVSAFLKADTEENVILVRADRVETITRNQEKLLVLYREARIVGEFPWENIYGLAEDIENED